MARMLKFQKSKKDLIPAGEAAKLYGCSESHLAHLGRSGVLTRHPEGPRAIYYDADEVRRVAKENEQLRKSRGGRPRRAG